MIPVIFDYADENDYTFDPLLIEVNPMTRATLAKLPVSGDEDFYASIRDGLEADRQTQTSSALLVGTATLANVTPVNVGAIGNQYLASIEQAVDDIVIYTGATINEIAEEFTIRTKFVPSYDQMPAIASGLFTLTETISSVNGRFEVQHLDDGKWSIRVTNAVGATKFTTTSASAHLLNINQEYEIEVVYSRALGYLVLFIDGLEVASSTFTANGSTRATATQTLMIGSGYHATFPSLGGYFRDIQLFTGLEHAVGDDFSADMPRIIPVYPIGSFTIENNSPVLADGMSDFMDMKTVLANTDITYIFRFKGERYYWDGAAWAISNGTLAQSNTIAEIDDNVQDDFGVDGGTVAMIALLTSTDGLSTPTLTELAFLYSFHGVDNGIPTSIIYGRIAQDEGVPLTDATLEFTSKPYFLNGNLVTVNETITVNQNTGYFEIILPEMTDESGGKVVIKMTDEESKKYTFKKNIKVTNVASNQLEDIII